MTITLTPEQEKFLADELSRGTFVSPEQAAAEAFRLLQARRERERKLESLRNEIEIGVNEIERGEVVDGEAAFAEVLAQIRKAKSKGA
ncbi:MAG: type II toxin-antitoxin system ParD family antitoxin [Verrucomicrobiota bacterium]